MNDNKKLEKRFIISIAISLIIVIFVMENVYKINKQSIDDGNILRAGTLDLSNSTMDEGQIIDLDGEWEFYPGLLLKPNDIAEDSDMYISKGTTINVPGSWENYLNNGRSAEGSGTYRLKIKVPIDGSYAIKTNTIRLASKIFINGQEVAKAGNTALHRKDFKPESKYRLAVGNSKNKEIDILIQVSSFGHRSGGIIKSIKFGTLETIVKDNNKARAIEALSISAALTLSIYFLIIYLQRNKELYLLYFSLINLIMAIYLSTMNEQLLDLIFNYNFIIRTKLQVICMILSSIFLLQFTHQFFYNYSNKKILNIFTYANIMSLFLTLLNPEKLSSYVAGTLQTLIAFGCIVSFVVVFFTLIKAISKKVDSLEYIFIIITTMVLYWFLIAIKVVFEIELGNIQTILIVLMLISAASIMSNRLHMDYKETKLLSEKLIRYDRQKDEFLAKASHELRTPLHIILNLTKNLIEGKKGGLNPTQQEDLLFIYQEGERLTNLVADLLDASRIKSGKISLNLQAINIYTLVDEILKEMQILVPDNKNIVLKNLISKDFPHIKADGDKIRQIIYNLVQNSIKYTEIGEVALNASIVEDQAQISVVDTGLGIREENLRNVFEVFFQENPIDSTQVSLGLGLSIVKHLVESHGGNINLESTYGKGSSFIFTIPLYCGDTVDIEEEASFNPVKDLVFKPEYKRTYVKNSKNILVVDDKSLNQKVILDILEPFDYNIILADNGAEALSLVEKEQIDLIILDFMLPDISGDRVCREIRKSYSMLELPILILTASGRTTDLMRAFDYGANDFLRKPILSEELISRIQSLLLMKNTVEEGLKREFQYFYSQISPHFLYNTINTIIGISYKDDEKAREALHNLSIYFRGKLDIHREEGLVTLESEIELVKAYLGIEELRYGEKLKIVYDIEENIEAMIPPLTLQPIAENSIRHGIMLKNSGTLKISIKRHKERLVKIIIEDNGVGMSAEKQEEILKGSNNRLGFKNIIKKMNILKGAEVHLSSVIGQGTKVEITIPEMIHDEGYID